MTLERRGWARWAYEAEREHVVCRHGAWTESMYLKARRAGSRKIGSGVADHDRTAYFATGGCDGAAKNFGIGFLDSEGVLAANGDKSLRQTKRIEQKARQSFQLVGADGQGRAGSPGGLQKFCDAWIWLAVNGGILAVVGQEVSK